MGKFVHACRALWSYKVQDALGWLCICLNAGVSIKSWNPNSTHRFITQITLSSETGNSLISLPTYGILSSSCVKPFITSNTDSVTYSDPIIFWPFYFIIIMTISLPVFDLLVLSLVIYTVYPSPAPSLSFIPCTQKYLTAWRKKKPPFSAFISYPIAMQTDSTVNLCSWKINGSLQCSTCSTLHKRSLSSWNLKFYHSCLTFFIEMIRISWDFQP